MTNQSNCPCCGHQSPPSTKSESTFSKETKALLDVIYKTVVILAFLSSTALNPAETDQNSTKPSSELSQIGEADFMSASSSNL